MKQDVSERYNKLDEANKKALKDVLDFFSDKIKESKEAAIKKGASEFELIEGFHIDPLNVTDEKDIVSFDIAGLLEKLEQKDHVDGERPVGGYLYRGDLKHRPTLGDLLVRTGLGYYVPWVSIEPQTKKAKKVHYCLVIPKFLYDVGVKVTTPSFVKRGGFSLGVKKHRRKRRP